MPDDPRSAVLDGLRRLRDQSLCGHCRDDYSAALKLVESEAEFETNARRYVERNPAALEVAERTSQIEQANAEVLRRMAPRQALGVPVQAPPDRLVRFRVSDVGGTIRSWREGFAEIRPRPFAFLAGGRRGGR